MRAIHLITSSARPSSGSGTVTPRVLARLEVDKQFYFCDQLDRQFGGIFALEDGSGINASLTMRLHEIASVTHQAAGDTEVAGLVDCRHRVADR